MKEKNCLRCREEIKEEGVIETEYQQVIGLCEACEELVGHAVLTYVAALDEAHGNYDPENALAELVRVLWPPKPPFRLGDKVDRRVEPCDKDCEECRDIECRDRKASFNPDSKE